jgi:hypothetical protein
MNPAQVSKPPGQDHHGVQLESGFARTACAFAEYDTAEEAQACLEALDGHICEALGPKTIQVCHFLFL